LKSGEEVYLNEMSEVEGGWEGRHRRARLRRFDFHFPL